MNRFVSNFLSSLGEVDGFILKSRSPSCGIKDVKVYHSAAEKQPPAIRKGFGLFGGAVLGRFPGLAAEDEERLENLPIRDHFLTRLWASSCLRTVERSGQLERLVDFHSRYTLLLMSCSQKELRILGRIVANAENRPWTEIMPDYGRLFRQALFRRPRFTATINVLMQALGYFRDGLSSSEKNFFLEQLESYRRGRLPLSEMRAVMASWIVRFGQEYLARQAFFNPYPHELASPATSSKGGRP
jgi:uncharacterized protein YbgA (DUF1722 family)